VWELYCSLSIWLNLFRFRVSACFTYDKKVINQRRLVKSAFENQSEEKSVWIVKWTTLLEIFCKLSFRPAVTSCYQVHAINADVHLSAALLCHFRCNWCRNLAAVNCILHWIVLTLSTLRMGITLQTMLEFYIIITSMKLNPLIIMSTVNSSTKSSKSVFQLVPFNWK